MTSRSVARSISQSVKHQLSNGPFVARVMSAFEHSCNLVTSSGDVVTLVTPQIGNGPLNIVVDDEKELFARIKSNTSVTLEKEQLLIGELQIDLKGASVWKPQPEWDKLRNQYDVIVSHLQLLSQLGHQLAPADSLMALLDTPLTDGRPTRAIFSAAQKAGKDLREGWAGNQEKLREAGAKLAGLGCGLTPAGDDFLTGTMLWAWLAHPDPNSFCHTLLQEAASRTTTLSAAFLRSAAHGECSKSWHALLAALVEGTKAEIAMAVQKVLAHGATSGADTLAGFLYLPQCST